MLMLINIINILIYFITLLMDTEAYLQPTNIIYQECL